MSSLDDQRTALEELHREINECKFCALRIPQLSKPSKMKRGDIGPVMIIGIGPGKTEIQKEEAFSGQSGIRLNEWLIGSGANPENPRQMVYTTSVVKCAADDAHFSYLAKNCRHFLNKQISIIQPRLVITLGTKPYEELEFTGLPFSEAVCNVFYSGDHVFATQVGFHYSLLPWPHPSGLNRWHNDEENNKKLKASFRIVQTFLIKSP